MSESSLAAAADFNRLNYANGKPLIKGQLKSIPEDFIVEEISDEVLSGQGEHLWCWVEKRGENTDWVAAKLAQWANTSKTNVGYAGQKDRHAVTRQWFSIQLPGQADPAAESLALDSVRILKMVRHSKKLQRGALAGNRFKITLRNLQAVDADNFNLTQLESYLTERFASIDKAGVPNYFGEQRFGRQANNLLEGEKLLTGDNLRNSRIRNRRKKGASRNQQGLYLSAIRSWMFNELLSRRIQMACWNKVLPGDVLYDVDKRPINATESTLPQLEKAIKQGEYAVTGALFGDGELQTSAEAQQIEQSVVTSYQAWCDGLANNRIQPDRRSLVMMPQQLNWCLEQQQESINLVVDFDLPAGSFATMLLRELLEVYEIR